MPVDDNFKVVIRGLEQGTCFYLFKPLTLYDVQNLWQHVIRKRKVNIVMAPNSEVAPWSATSLPQHLKHLPTEDIFSSFHHNKSLMRDVHRKNNNQKRISRDVKHPRDDNKHGKDKPSMLQKKPRVVWTPLLHDQLLEAICNLGIESK
ncbi:hypothetical protein Sjap_020164 [Stephania japonica]|uniref:Response regulatory domain-containing protein n=1 Tax=Stephania japonica TaxID=461633 RepID=A0AAP0F058_9MAGN